MPLMAGIATVDITPPVGTWLAGFAGRYKGSEGIHDPLRARALVLDDGTTRLALITNDVLSISFESVDALKRMIADECGIGPERVMHNCSHTHSGPVMRRVTSSPEAGDDALMLTYMRKIVGAVKMAIADLKPARLGVGRTEVQVGINRRERTPDGGTKLGRNPDLPVAPYVDVWRVDGVDGCPRAIFFSHACHPVTRAADNYQISADYPGRAQQVVELVFPGCQAMFGQGCAGNINSEPCGGSFEDVWRLGTALGGAVVKAAAFATTTPDVSLRSVYEHVEIPLEDPPPVSEARARLAKAQEQYDRAVAERSAEKAGGEEANLRWAQRVLDLSKQGVTDLKMRYDMQAFGMNDAVIVALPGEVFVEYQLNIAAASPFAFTTVLGVSNGCPSYIPTAAEFPFGGYEVDSSMRFYGATRLSPRCEQVILHAADRLLGQLAAGPA